eukprot:scpid95232/ scgid21118/ 
MVYCLRNLVVLSALLFVALSWPTTCSAKSVASLPAVSSTGGPNIVALCRSLKSTLRVNRGQLNILQSHCNLNCTKVATSSITSAPKRVPDANLPLVHKSLRMEFVNETVTGRLPMTMEVLHDCSSYYDKGEHLPCRCVVYHHGWVKVKYEMSCTDGTVRWLKQLEKVRRSCSCYHENSCPGKT